MSARRQHSPLWLVILAVAIASGSSDASGQLPRFRSPGERQAIQAALRDYGAQIIEQHTVDLDMYDLDPGVLANFYYQDGRLESVFIRGDDPVEPQASNCNPGNLPRGAGQAYVRLMESLKPLGLSNQSSYTFDQGDHTDHYVEHPAAAVHWHVHGHGVLLSASEGAIESIEIRYWLPTEARVKSKQMLKRTFEGSEGQRSSSTHELDLRLLNGDITVVVSEDDYSRVAVGDVIRFDLIRAERNSVRDISIVSAPDDRLTQHAPDKLSHRNPLCTVSRGS